MKIQFYGHAGIKIEDNLVILIDPWLNDNPLATIRAKDITKADYIIATHNHSAVGCAASGRRGSTQRRSGLSGRLLLRASPEPWFAVGSYRPLGPVLFGLRGHRDCGVHAHWVIVENARHLLGRSACRRSFAEFQQRHGVTERFPLLRSARSLSGPQTGLQRRSDRLVALHPGAG